MFTKKQLLAKDNLHHAYLIEGEYDQVFPELLSYLKEHKLIAGPNDVYQNSSETLTIDLSRLIKVQQAEKSAHKFFILGANFFTREAANSLLKVFEEPTPGTHFFLITPNPHLLPATLRSRLHFISAENKKGIKPEVLEEAKKFLENFFRLPLSIINPDSELIWKASEIKAEYSISYADCFAADCL